MKSYTVNFIATLGVDVEADDEEEALYKAHEAIDVREFEIVNTEIVEND